MKSITNGSWLHSFASFSVDRERLGLRFPASRESQIRGAGMPKRFATAFLVLTTAVVMVLGLTASPALAAKGDPASSVVATWSCTSSLCPSGQSYTSNTAVWPAAAEPVRARYGYTVSHDVYAPAPKVAGWKITVTSGSATVFAGPADDSHSSLANLQTGDSYTLPSTLSSSSLVSVQDGGSFEYTITPGTPTDPPPASGAGSVLATWNCTSSPCPSGQSYTSNAGVWPAAAQPVRARYGYTVSADVYAPVSKVAGWKITVTSGSATVYAGLADDSHSSLAALSAGESYTVSSTLSNSSIVSVQDDGAFRVTFTPGEPTTPPPASGDGSVLATWNCTGTPCPSGASYTSNAAVWPATAEPTRARYGYTVSHDVYAPVSKVAGWKITVTSGSATVYAGPADDSHSSLAALSAGESYTVSSTLSNSSIVSVQDDGAFRVTFTPGEPTTPPPASGDGSVLATWNCTGTPCPSGASYTSNAAVWPATAEPTRARYGYTVSHDVYAPVSKVAGWKITVTSGSATVYAGPADDSHSSLAALSAGESYTVSSTLSNSSIVSVQDDGAFRVTFTPGEPTTPPPASGDGSVLATWNCTGTPCPSGASYTSNAGVWPAAAQPVRARYGYTVSADVYAPVSKVAGWKITVTSGSATVYAGLADDSHSSLAALSAGESYTVSSTLSNSSIVSVQDDGAFRVTFTPGEPTTPPPASGDGSVLATWNCTGTPCPSGASYTSNAAVWPATAEPTRARYGYTVSHDVYAPAAKVAGWKITVTSGSAAVYAGPVGDSHSSLAALSAGESYTVSSTLS